MTLLPSTQHRAACHKQMGSTPHFWLLTGLAADQAMPGPQHSFQAWTPRRGLPTVPTLLKQRLEEASPQGLALVAGHPLDEYTETSLRGLQIPPLTS